MSAYHGVSFRRDAASYLLGNKFFDADQYFSRPHLACGPQILHTWYGEITL